MSNEKKLARRRAATFVAALGMLVMSSGVALMVAATPANAIGQKVGICHATGSDSNPYVFIEPDIASVLNKKGHLQHREDPNKTWKSDGTFNGIEHDAGDPKPDLISDFSYNGTDYVYDGVVTAATCEGGVIVENPPATADVDFIDPECENENTADFDATLDHASYEITDGEAAPGAFIQITVTADEGYAFEEDQQTVFEHTYDPAEICDITLPPTPVVPGEPSFVDPTCDTAPQVNLPEPAPTEEEPPVLQRKAELIDIQDIDGVHYVVTGDLVAGGTVDVDATALDGYEIEEGATTHWSHTFTTPEGCEEVVVPPAVIPPVVDTPDETTVVPSVVHAGLASDIQDLRGEQGLALLVAGMIMMVVAGGLGFRKTQSEI